MWSQGSNNFDAKDIESLGLETNIDSIHQMIQAEAGLLSDNNN